MKLYKLRPLSNNQEFDRVSKIIETGKFWCSKFSELNDPMEGVFTISNQQNIDEIYSNKNNYKLCSFSSENGMINPALWGYYAGGFKGVAIEIEIVSNQVHPVDYVNEIQTTGGNSNDFVKILTSKLKCWKHEAEYRVLHKDIPNEFKIGNITSVYFGAPYEDLANKDDIYADNPHLECYHCYRDRLKKICRDENISCHDVRIEGIKVVSSNSIS